MMEGTLRSMLSSALDKMTTARTIAGERRSVLQIHGTLNAGGTKTHEKALLGIKREVARKRELYMKVTDSEYT